MCEYETIDFIDLCLDCKYFIRREYDYAYVSEKVKRIKCTCCAGGSEKDIIERDCILVKCNKKELTEEAKLKDEDYRNFKKLQADIKFVVDCNRNYNNRCK